MFDMKKQLMWSKLRVSFVITLALLILFLTVFFAGSIQDMFLPKVELQAQIQDVKGLRKGSPVWVSGIEVGSVKNINLHPQYGTVVTLSVNKSALRYIKKDSQASVLTMGLLGDKYVELSAGSSQAESIKPGDMIRGAAQLELKDVMEASAASIQKLSDFIKRLDDLVVKMEKGEGTISKFLRDPGIYNDLKETTKTLYSISKEIESSQGTLKFLIKDPSLYNKMLSASSAVDEFSRKLNEGDGTLKRLVEDAELYENMKNASIKLSSILEKIDMGEGIAGRLVKDEEMAKELKDAVSELRELTRDIKEHPKKYFKFSIF